MTETMPAAGSSRDAAEEGDRGSTGCDSLQVDVNRADTDRLQRIVHIGSARAEQLVRLRPFVNLRDLTRIPGIAEARLSDILEQAVACAG